MPLTRGRRLPANVELWIARFEAVQRNFCPPPNDEPPALPDKHYAEEELSRYRRTVRNYRRYKASWQIDYDECEKKFQNIFSSSPTVADKIAVIDELLAADHTHGMLKHLSVYGVAYIPPARLQKLRHTLEGELR